MTRSEHRDRLRDLLSTLEMPVPWDTNGFAAMLSDRLGKAVVMRTMPAVGGVAGFTTTTPQRVVIALRELPSGGSTFSTSGTRWDTSCWATTRARPWTGRARKRRPPLVICFSRGMTASSGTVVRCRPASPQSFGAMSSTWRDADGYRADSPDRGT